MPLTFEDLALRHIKKNESLSYLFQSWDLFQAVRARTRLRVRIYQGKVRSGVLSSNRPEGPASAIEFFVTPGLVECHNTFRVGSTDSATRLHVNKRSLCTEVLANTDRNAEFLDLQKTLYHTGAIRACVEQQNYFCSPQDTSLTN